VAKCSFRSRVVWLKAEAKEDRRAVSGPVSPGMNVTEGCAESLIMGDAPGRDYETFIVPVFPFPGKVKRAKSLEA
jgi:hypothetical protein